MKIAIIGSGISGLGAALILSQNHEVTLYEKNNRLGGHSRTIDVNFDDNHGTPVDTGFIVFNKRNYPHLTALFDWLNVPYEKSDMSFGASIANGWLEYGSKGIFAQKKNLLRPSYYKMLLDIVRFNKKAKAYVERHPHGTLKDCLNDLKMGDWFRLYYLQAMGAAIWSCSVETILKFPASSFIRFFDNHGLLTIKDHPQWYTVTGGSREYIAKIWDHFDGKVQKQSGAVSVEALSDSMVKVTNAEGDSKIFDHVVMACHADEALALYKNPTQEQADTLGAFTYQSNHIIVHGDKSFMPHNRQAWASWVYLSETQKDKNESVALTYWMNNLQNLDSAYPLFVTLNSDRRPDESLIYDEHDFTHPVFTQEAVAAQANIPSIQGQQNVWFCGAYQRYGFHEDGLLSAVNMAEKMGEGAPWL